MACNAGVDPVGYWDMTYREIKASIEARNERYKEEAELQKVQLQNQTIISYRQAHLIGALVSKIMGGKGSVPTLEEAYPGIFPEELLKQPTRQDWRVMKDRIADYAERRRKRGDKQRGTDN